MTHGYPNTDTLHRLPRGYPEGWSPDEIVLIQLGFDVTGAQLNFRLGDAFVYPPTDINVFLQRYVQGKLPPPTEVRPPDPKRRAALVVPVTKPSTVVLVLDKAREWQFRSSGPAVTSKYDYGSDNFRLIHMDAELRGLSGHGPGDGCRLVYFSVGRRGWGEAQHFNFHLDLLQEGGRWLEVIARPGRAGRRTRRLP